MCVNKISQQTLAIDDVVVVVFAVYPVHLINRNDDIYLGANATTITASAVIAVINAFIISVSVSVSKVPWNDEMCRRATDIFLLLEWIEWQFCRKQRWRRRRSQNVPQWLVIEQIKNGILRVCVIFLRCLQLFRVAHNTTLSINYIVWLQLSEKCIASFRIHAHLYLCRIVLTLVHACGLYKEKKIKRIGVLYNVEWMAMTSMWPQQRASSQVCCLPQFLAS